MSVTIYALLLMASENERLCTPIHYLSPYIRGAACSHDAHLSLMRNDGIVVQTSTGIY
jgi:hypothetical protein